MGTEITDKWDLSSPLVCQNCSPWARWLLDNQVSECHPLEETLVLFHGQNSCNKKHWSIFYLVNIIGVSLEAENWWKMPPTLPEFTSHCCVLSRFSLKWFKKCSSGRCQLWLAQMTFSKIIETPNVVCNMHEINHTTDSQALDVFLIKLTWTSHGLSMPYWTPPLLEPFQWCPAIHAHCQQKKILCQWLVSFAAGIRVIT